MNMRVPENGVPYSKNLAHRAVACLATLLVGMGVSAAARATVVTLDPPDTTVTVGDVVTMRAIVDAEPDIKAFELIYQYDPVRLQFTGTTAGEVLTGSFYTDFVTPDNAAPADSVIYDAAVLLGSTAGPGVLVYVNFKALATGDAAITGQLGDFRDSQNNRTLAQMSNSVIHIRPATGVGDLPGNRFALAAPSPNPLGGSRRGHFPFVLPRAGAVRLELFDASGRRVAQSGPRAFAAGAHVIDLDAAGISAGVYFARLTTDWGQSAWTRLAVIH